MTPGRPVKFTLTNIPESPVETPLSHLTTTNDPPSEDEIGIVHAIIDADKASIDKIDRILERISDLHKMVHNRRLEYTQRIGQHERVLKPHRSLPSDVLCEIFQHILFDMRAAFGSPYSPHRVLGKVCHRWRNILYSNPRLWSMLPEINLDTNWTRRQGFNSILNTALQLSRAAPLNLEIRFVKPSNLAPHPTLTLLVPLSDRYRRLSLSIFHQYLPQLASIRGKLGGLRSLELHIHRDSTADFPDSMHAPLNLFDNTPNLQNLTVNNGPFPTHFCQWLSVPWPQLVRFSGHWVKPIDIVTVLTHATSLEDCTFYCASPPMASGFLPSIIHHRLIKLRMYPQEEVNEPFPLDVLNTLTLPGLLEITIKNIPLQTAILVDLVTRSRCALTFIDLETSIHGDMFSFLSAISAVRVLCVIPTVALLELMLNDQTQRPVLPRLRYLMFYSMASIPPQVMGWIPLARVTQSTVDPLAIFIITQIKLRRSHYEALYDQLDQWPGLDAWEAQFPVYKRWIKLVESSTFESQDQAQQAIVAKYLSEIEGLGELHPRSLYARVGGFTIHDASLSNQDTKRSILHSSPFVKSCFTMDINAGKLFELFWVDASTPHRLRSSNRNHLRQEGRVTADTDECTII
ncbi:hypothetical protein BYT27DRAFT_6805624 [Phlegmacium glaucopus]|nr:hypothetical protein BYT27DRAFT_6805624 [Phlegmacium glaucopus]